LAINYEESFSRNGATAQSLPGFRMSLLSLRRGAAA